MKIFKTQKKKIPIPFSALKSWDFSFESLSRHYFDFSEIKNLAAIVSCGLTFTFQSCYILTSMY